MYRHIIICYCSLLNLISTQKTCERLYISNGFAKNPGSSQVDFYVQVVCFDGYQLIEGVDKNVLCRNDGTWSHYGPFCELSPRQLVTKEGGKAFKLSN